jgi:F-type H+-transporting ATPase subunit epsilon
MVTSIKLEIVTPEGVFCSEEVELVTLQGVEGQLTVLPQHVRLMTQLVPGEMIIRKAGHDRFLAIGEGLVAVSGDRVSVLTDLAIAAESIDEAKIQEAQQRAAARRGETISAEEVASVNAAIARSLAELRVKRRHRT